MNWIEFDNEPWRQKQLGEEMVPTLVYKVYTQFTASVVFMEQVDIFT